ncbi:MAG: hypothetical protein KIT34_03855 [Cyanobacteria bacterium TGS_CYA1]|nr:hypothetical protein [Cyanobacteria bacterium TGS_CYA1]
MRSQKSCQINLSRLCKTLSIVVACHLTAATVECNWLDLPAQAKKSKTASNNKNSTRAKASGNSSKTSRKKNSSISFKNSERQSKHDKHKASEKRHGKPDKHHESRHEKHHGKHHEKAHHESHREIHHEVHHKSPPPEPQAIEPTLSEEEKQELAQRQSNYSTQSSAYALMDQGINTRLQGDADSSINKLSESSSLFTDARRFQKNRTPGTLELFSEYELAQAYEAKNPPDWKSARDSYGRCVRANPKFVPAHIRLISLLAGHGQMPLALSKARDAVAQNPKEPRLRMILALLYEKAGKDSDARREKKLAVELNRINKDDYKNREPMTEPGPTEYDKPGESEFEDESMFQDKDESSSTDKEEN